MQIYQPTTRTSNLLKKWTSGPKPLFKVLVSPAFKFKVSFDAGKTEDLALFIRACCELGMDKPYSWLGELALREMDFYLRDNSREAVFQNQEKAEQLLFEAKMLIGSAILTELVNKGINKNSLGAKALIYQVALDIYANKQEIAGAPFKLHDFEISTDESLIIVDFEENLDKKTQHLEKLNGHFIELFQDDRFNVIPV